MSDDGFDADDAIRELRLGHEKEIEDASSSLENIIEGLPVVGEVFGVGRQIKDLLAIRKRQRLREFLRAVDWRLQQLDENDREAAKDVLKSSEGLELLENYARKLSDTFSPTGRAVLAILYADELANQYPTVFHRLASRSLKGLSEAELDFFLGLEERAEEREGGFERLKLSIAVINQVAEECGIPRQMSYAVVDNLMNRGLLPRGNITENFSQAEDFYTWLDWRRTASRFAELIRKGREVRDELGLYEEEVS